MYTKNKKIKTTTQTHYKKNTPRKINKKFFLL